MCVCLHVYLCVCGVGVGVDVGVCVGVCVCVWVGVWRNPFFGGGCTAGAVALTRKRRELIDGNTLDAWARIRYTELLQLCCSSVATLLQLCCSSITLLFLTLLALEACATYADVC